VEEEGRSTTVEYNVDAMVAEMIMIGGDMVLQDL
jgi:hypothetical protein